VNLVQQTLPKGTFFQKKGAVELYDFFKFTDLPGYLYFFETRTRYKYTGEKSEKIGVHLSSFGC